MPILLARDCGDDGVHAHDLYRERALDLHPRLRSLGRALVLVPGIHAQNMCIAWYSINVEAIGSYPYRVVG